MLSAYEARVLRQMEEHLGRHDRRLVRRFRHHPRRWRVRRASVAHWTKVVMASTAGALVALALTGMPWWWVPLAVAVALSAVGSAVHLVARRPGPGSARPRRRRGPAQRRPSP